MDLPIGQAVYLTSEQLPGQAADRNGSLQVQTLQSLRHRNIVQYYGACIEPDCLGIVTGVLPCAHSWIATITSGLAQLQ